MEIIKILYSKLLQEKAEKEFELEDAINTKRISRSIELLKEISIISLSLITLEQYIDKPNTNKD